MAQDKPGRWVVDIAKKTTTFVEWTSKEWRAIKAGAKIIDDKMEVEQKEELRKEHRRLILEEWSEAELAKREAGLA